MKRLSFNLFNAFILIFALCLSGCGVDVDGANDENLQGIKFTLQDDGTYAVACGDTTHLADIVLPTRYNGSKVVRIEDNAFEKCNDLKSIIIPRSVTTIGANAFQQCFYLESIEIPDSVTSVGEYAFSDCYALTNVVLPRSITRIEQETFIRCHFLESVTIPRSVTSIGEGAFEGCRSLKKMTIPDSVTIVEQRTFINCNALKEITLPDSVTSIGYGAFLGCSSLDTIKFGGTVEQWNNIDKASNWIDSRSNIWYDSYLTVICSNGTLTLKL